VKFTDYKLLFDGVGPVTSLNWRGLLVLVRRRGEETSEWILMKFLEPSNDYFFNTHYHMQLIILIER